VERATHVAGAPLVVELRGERNCLGIGFDDGVQQRVQLGDALEVAKDELAAGQLPGREHCLQLRNRFLNEGGGPWGRKGVGRPEEQADSSRH
jgi:hypothetical protein